MTLLARGESTVDSVFGIQGEDENSMSAGFAYVLAQSGALLRLVVDDLIPGLDFDPTDVSVRVQSSRRGEGITDIEIEIPDSAFIVFEAKKAMALPAISQLRQYAPRCRGSGCPQVLLVALTATEREPAGVVLGVDEVDGVPVGGRSWRWLRRLLTAAVANEKGNRVRWLLSEYRKYLEGFMGHDRLFSNLVYVVSLAHGNPEGWKVSWIDVVEKYDRYFYPAGGRSWPPPPNYLGFRYDGQLQAIRHVETFEIVPDIRKCFPGSEGGPDWGSYYLFTLGRPIKPGRKVGTGPRVQRSARVWCMLDTLLTCDTISDALTETERRKEAHTV